MKCLHCGANLVGFHFGPKCPNGCEEKRFQLWFTEWQGVFANESQARKMFDEAQPPTSERA